MYVETKSLPSVLRTALKHAGHHCKDIEIETTESISPQSWGDDGSRGFFGAVDLVTGHTETQLGSWGGPNMFAAPRVDVDRDRYQIPKNVVCIQGQVGGRVYLGLYCRPEQLQKLLPPQDSVDLSGIAHQALYCFREFKGGQYRRNELKRRNVRESDVDDLVTTGHLKRSKAGSIQVTTKGKNVCIPSSIRFSC